MVWNIDQLKGMLGLGLAIDSLVRRAARHSSETVNMPDTSIVTNEWINNLLRVLAGDAEASN